NFLLQRAALGPATAWSPACARYSHPRWLVVAACRNAKPALHPLHLAVDFLDLGHERFFALGKFYQFFKGRARNVSKHSVFFPLRSTMQPAISKIAARLS